MKAIVRLKSFPGHKGIPGHQGGSLPENAGSSDITEADNPYQSGFYSQKPNETNEQYDARIARGREYRKLKRVEEDARAASDASWELDNLKRNKPNTLMDMADTIARKMAGTWDWQGSLPEQHDITGLKKYIRKAMKERFGDMYDVIETPFGNGKSRYMLVYKKK
jgi:hypothetical protein